jgi:hypothetical protein
VVQGDLMNFINSILGGFNSVISFLGSLFSPLFSLIGKGFNALLDLLEKPLSYVFYFFDGVFYFIEKLFSVVVLIVKIFVAFFQFLGSLILGVFRTIHMWIIPSLSDNTHFPSASEQGFQTVIDLISPTGLTTVVPIVAIAFCWFFFVLKIISLFGGSISVTPFGNKEGN